ncbi:MAG: phosphocholine cytidylyltransferase family protein [Anaerolineae bacterium]|jgi:choline kinase|nr:phosphocholine cytidylyltransferase family protein [Anaerolineae bacterium]MDH7474966.1 phosphocholine cytidylyltransferase family protein [Anaerolineae bacterium]
MKGVILAAGDGSRLAPLTNHRPKPLVPVLGRPLIEYTIRSFAQVGIRELIIVIGYRGEMIAQEIGYKSTYGLKVSYAPNPWYKGGNGTSIHAARPFLANEPFILSMADHMITASLLKKLLGMKEIDDSLCIDRSAKAPPQVKDATKVWVNDLGLVTRIGKDLEHWNAIDTGVFLFTPHVFSVVSALMEEQKGCCTVTDAVRRLIKQKGLRACDVSGAFWMDVDTLADLRYVERLLRPPRGNHPAGISSGRLNVTWKEKLATMD